MLHLVTGYAGEEHITSADEGAFNMATFGSGENVMDRGNKFAATIVSNNLITISDGEALMQGRFIKMIMGTTEEVTIENGTQGMNRNDLICLRYEKNSSTGVETASLVVKKGTETSGTPTDPAYTTGDITDGSDLVNEMPLYRVTLNGLNISGIKALFSIRKPASESGGLFPQLIISVQGSSSVTVVNKDDPSEILEVTQKNNLWYCDVPHYGTWTITSGTITEDVVVDTVKQYNIELSSVHIYGISRSQSTSSTQWTRTDEAVGATFSASVGSTAGASSFDAFYPWSGIERVTKNNDVFVKIPKFWFRRYISGGVEYIKIADRETDGFALHPAFKRGNVEYNNIYVGAYHTASGYVSRTGFAPLVSITRATARTGSHGRGSNYYQWDKATQDAIAMLILVETADWDVQTTIGRGYCDSNSSAINSGSCDAVARLTGRPSGTDGKTGVVWRGIENLWGNIYQWVDGLNVNSGALYVCNIPDNFADDTSTNYTSLSYNQPASSGWIMQEGCDSNHPAYIIPTVVGGSDNTYIPDYVWVSSSGWHVAYVGGRWSNGSRCGLGALDLASASSSTYTNIGSRLMYLEAS